MAEAGQVYLLVGLKVTRQTNKSIIYGGLLIVMNVLKVKYV